MARVSALQPHPTSIPSPNSWITTGTQPPLLSSLISWGGSIHSDPIRAGSTPQLHNSSHQDNLDSPTQVVENLSSVPRACPPSLGVTGPKSFSTSTLLLKPSPPGIFPKQQRWARIDGLSSQTFIFITFNSLYPLLISLLPCACQKSRAQQIQLRSLSTLQASKTAPQWLGFAERAAKQP